MTPKEKAEYLIRKMTIDFSIEYAQSRLCALVCCDEIIYCLEIYDIDNINYWESVKIELEKLN